MVSSAAFSDVKVPDGYLWESLDNDVKELFIVGVAQGEGLVTGVLLSKGEELIAKMVWSRLGDERTIEQVVKDIDKYYKDNPDDKKLLIIWVYIMTLDQSRKGK